MKQKCYEKLSQNLDQIVKQYRLLLDCLRKEKELLISNDIENLNLSNVLKENILSDLKSLDSLRMLHARELAQAIGLQSDEPRLLELAQKMLGAEGDRLRLMHSALELLMKNITDCNKDNAQYAESALNTVSSAMENIKETLRGQKTYQKKGNYQQGYDKSGHLVSREA